MPRPPLHLLLLLLALLLALLPALLATCPSPRPTTCLPSLSTHPHLYTACLTTPCFLFLSSPPFTTLPTPLPPPPHVPFPCASPAPYTGLTFAIHAHTPPALCLYAGNCSFNQLTHFTHSHPQYRFAITGLLIHTPERLCFHDPASPILEDAMVIIGKSTAVKRVQQLVRPFSPLTWLIFATAALLILGLAFAIALITHGKPSISTAVFVATGLSHTRTAFTPHPAIAATLLKISLAVLITLLALFYEAGVVNFLFQANTAQLGKTVRSLSASELARYSVLKDSALEMVWNDTVNPNGDLYDPVVDQPPWKRCNSHEECVRWVADPENDVLFDVTFGVLARFLIQKVSSCDKLTVFQTKDILYQFTGGWLYGESIPKTYRQRLDRLLIGLRINRTLGNIFDEQLTSVTCEQTITQQLGPVVVGLPILIVVFPPLLGSVLIMFCFKHKPHPNDANAHDAATAATPKISSAGISSAAVVDINHPSITQDFSQSVGTSTQHLHSLSIVDNDVNTPHVQQVQSSDDITRISTQELQSSVVTRVACRKKSWTTDLEDQMPQV